MRIGWMVLALLTAGNAAAVDVTVFVSLDGGGSTYGSKRIADSLLKGAGVTVVWQARKRSISGRRRIWLHIEIAEDTPDEFLPGALAVSYPYAGCGKSITVFFDRIQSLARGFVRESMLLGYVLAHEIAHVLQGVDRHSETGVMKAHWSAEDRAAIFDRRMGFEEEDVELMRRGLATGLCRTPPLIGQFE